MLEAMKFLGQSQGPFFPSQNINEHKHGHIYIHALHSNLSGMMHNITMP